MMRIDRLAAVAAAALLSGCAGVSYTMQEYSGVKVEEVAMPDVTYRIFDKPAVNKMMVTSSLGSAAAQGFGSGLLLNAVDNTPPKPRYDAAALQYLENTGRSGCRVIDSYILMKPQFEVKYDCTPVTAAPVPPVTKRRVNASRS